MKLTLWCLNHSKHILWYRWFAHSSRLLGMPRIGTLDFGEWLVELPLRALTQKIPLGHRYLWPFYVLLTFLQAPTCLIAPLRMRFISELSLWLRRDMLCQGATVWTKNSLTNGSLPTGHTGAFLIVVDWDTEPRKPSEVDKKKTKWPVIKWNYFKRLVMHLINSRLGADHTIPRLVRMCYLDIHRGP